MARARRVPLPGLSFSRRAPVRVRYPVPARYSLVAFLIWAGSLLFVGVLAGYSVHSLSLALAVVPLARPKRDDCEVCAAGDLWNATAAPRYVAEDATSVAIRMCDRHVNVVQACRAYLRRREKAVAQ